MANPSHMKREMIEQKKDYIIGTILSKKALLNLFR